jgi:hypothetical protein
MNKKPAAKDLSKKHHDDIMAALDNQLKMFLHLERMVEKMAAKVDALFELVGSTNAVESAGPNSQSSTPKGYQGKAMQLTNPNLIKLYDRVVRMEVTGRERNKFHNSFVHKYRLLLLFYQKHGHPKPRLIRKMIKHFMILSRIRRLTCVYTKMAKDLMQRSLDTLNMFSF